MEHILNDIKRLYLSPKHVHFSDSTEFILIPFEERKGEWMTYAIDRVHFKRRIQQSEKLISPILQKKLDNTRCAI